MLLTPIYKDYVSQENLGARNGLVILHNQKLFAYIIGNRDKTSFSTEGKRSVRNHYLTRWNLHTYQLQLKKNAKQLKIDELDSDNLKKCAAGNAYFPVKCKRIFTSPKKSHSCYYSRYLFSHLEIKEKTSILRIFFKRERSKVLHLLDHKFI